MPWAARAWGALLPLTHDLRLTLEQTLRGTPASSSLGSLATLAVFVVVGLALAGLRLPAVTREARFWGRT